MSVNQILIRRYIQQFIQEKKERNHRFSIRMAADKLGVDSSLLCKFMNGKKNLGIHTIVKIKKKLKIVDELDFTKLEPNYEKVSFLKLNDQSTFKEWYYYLVLEYIQSVGKLPQADQLAQKLNLTPKLISLAIQSLKESGVVVVNGNRAEVAAEFITNFHDSENTVRIHRSFLERSLLALNKWDEGTRSVHNLTIAIDSAQFKIYVSEIRKALAKINKMSVKTKKRHDKIFLLNVSFFPELKL